jgi:hypothetical protein
MTPYLREKKVKGSGRWKQDHHPRKGLINWWEDFNNFISRRTMKQNLKKEL